MIMKIIINKSVYVYICNHCDAQVEYIGKERPKNKTVDGNQVWYDCPHCETHSLYFERVRKDPGEEIWK